ncbi:MAG: nucleoside recognition domain-containing protein, partial [Bdellovibrionota bacterium]
MAVIFRRTLFRGKNPALLMELPTYKWPSARNIVIGLLERSRLFLRRAGTVILTLSIVLWFLASYPKAPLGASGPAIAYSYAGRIGTALEPLVRPLGFNWKIAVALIPGFAAREVMIGALGTVYAVEGGKENVATLLSTRIAQEWSLATALSLLMWYVLAMQCLSTLAVTRRETNSWRWPALMLGYMTALAYFGAFATYHIAVWLGA